jgi:hypothetical protein
MKVEEKVDGVLFLPVVGAGFEVYNKPTKVCDKNINPFGEGDLIFKYEALLTNYHNLDDKKSIREKYKIRDDVVVVGDSGGYQILKLGKLADASSVIRRLENNCNYGMILDHPPIAEGYTSTVSETKFEDCLSNTYNDTKTMCDKRKNSDFLLLNVLHGDTLERMNKWYEKQKGFDLDGWAVAPKPAFNPLNQVFYFLFLWDKGEFSTNRNKIIHFLGSSTPTITILYNYILKKLFQDRRIIISYDSSTWTAAHRWKVWIEPFSGTLTKIGSEELTGVKNMKELRYLPCPCEVCGYINRYIEENNLNLCVESDVDSIPRFFPIVALHNMKYFIDMGKILGSTVKFDSTLNKKYVDFLVGNSLFLLEKSKTFIDEYIAGADLSSLYRRYSKHIEKRENGNYIDSPLDGDLFS